ncbi:L-seryl-tRNA(Sec) selenium transferase [Candidatus Poribacteria bacterium]|nr:L-seryl-tRNA(Sec) selenium transferase [Candidatus Poribacteria bacterium]
MAQESRTNLSRIPSVEKVKQTPKVMGLLQGLTDAFVTEVVREVLEEIRSGQKKARKNSPPLELGAIEDEVVGRASARLSPALRRVINGTGVVIHTNLGRSLVGPKVIAAMADVAARYCNLEIDLSTGERGHRDSVIEPVICSVTGAEAATVVNNNAAAVMLALDTFAKGREVIVSRGELVEIGGSFRIPEVMAKSGAKLVEVGATNRTYIYDYERALSPETALLLKVHPSNYRIVGFTNQTPLSELVELGRKHGVPVMEDLGSGAIVDMTKFGISGEPTPQASVKTGADIVTFSGDKLLGGPQAGIVVGKAEYVRAIRKNPLMRALRVDKMTLSALGVLFQILQSSRAPEKEIPTLGIISRTPDDIGKMAGRVLDEMGSQLRRILRADIADGESQIGGGSCPGQTLPTKLLIIKPEKLSPEQIASRLRRNSPPIIGIIRNDSFCLDFRTVQADELSEIVAAFREIAAGA